MTIQEAIDKAIEGGYPRERVEALSLHVQAQYFLETTFWEALVRALGVEGDFEFIHLDRREPRKLRQPMWLYYWHRFTRHLVAGKTPHRSSRLFPPSPEASGCCAAYTAPLVYDIHATGVVCSYAVCLPLSWHSACTTRVV